MQPYSATKRTTIFRTARERAGPVGRNGTAVRSRRVSSTQASIGRVSRRSKISRGDGFAAGDGTRCWEEVVLAKHFVVLAFLVGAFLEAVNTFGAGYLLLAFLLVLVTGAFLGASVISVGGGWGGETGWALATRPPRSTWFQPSPRLSCSADGWGRVGAVRTSPEGAPLLTTGPTGARLSLLPFPAAPVVGGVVTPTAAAFKLLFGGRALA